MDSVVVHSHADQNKTIPSKATPLLSSRNSSVEAYMIESFEDNPTHVEMSREGHTEREVVIDQGGSNGIEGKNLKKIGKCGKNDFSSSTTKAEIHQHLSRRTIADSHTTRPLSRQRLGLGKSFDEGGASRSLDPSPNGYNNSLSGYSGYSSEDDPTLRDMRPNLSALKTPPSSHRGHGKAFAASSASRVRPSQSIPGLSSYASGPVHYNNFRCTDSQLTSSHPSLHSSNPSTSQPSLHLLTNQETIPESRQASYPTLHLTHRMGSSAGRGTSSAIIDRNFQKQDPNSYDLSIYDRSKNRENGDSSSSRNDRQISHESDLVELKQRLVSLDQQLKQTTNSNYGNNGNRKNVRELITKPIHSGVSLRSNNLISSANTNRKSSSILDYETTKNSSVIGTRNRSSSAAPLARYEGNILQQNSAISTNLHRKPSKNNSVDNNTSTISSNDNHKEILTVGFKGASRSRKINPSGHGLPSGHEGNSVVGPSDLHSGKSSSPLTRSASVDAQESHKSKTSANVLSVSHA